MSDVPPNPYDTPQVPPLGDREIIVVDKDQKNWAMFCHLAALAGYLIPFGNVIGPLIVWMVKKDEMPFVDDQGKEAINFQISMTLYILLAGISIFCVIGIVLLPAAIIIQLVFTIVAAVKAGSGEPYRYPLTIRFIK